MRQQHDYFTAGFYNYCKDLTRNMDKSRNNSPQAFQAFKHLTTLLLSAETFEQ